MIEAFSFLVFVISTLVGMIVARLVSFELVSTENKVERFMWLLLRAVFVGLLFAYSLTFLETKVNKTDLNVIFSIMCMAIGFLIQFDRSANKKNEYDKLKQELLQREESMIDKPR